ncbi:hypothetical protein Bhyg_13005, partial [Pseudolycoriella hygida]
MISIIIFVAVVLQIHLTLGQTSTSINCTNSPSSSCVYNQIRCPPNYFFNGQYCLPLQATAALTQPLQPTQLPKTKCTPRSPLTVSPTNPDPLPVKPVCEPFYEWNGQECYKVLSDEAICTSGNLTASGQCVSVMQGVCQENYHIYGGYCVGLLEAPVVCPPNYQWDGKVCVYRIDASCPDGYVLKDGYCEKMADGSCPSGTIMDGSRCLGHHQVDIFCEFGYIWDYDSQNCVNSTNSCGEGFELKDNVCEKYIYKTPDYECPPRTQMVGSECVSVEWVCPKGFTLINNICVEIIASTNGTESGNELECETGKVNETTTATPPEYTTIRPTSPTPTPSVCPIDYEIINGKCEPKKPDDNGKIPPIEPSNCSDDHILIQGVCVPLPKCPQINCQTNYTSSCVCPVRCDSNNGSCATQNVCPTGCQHTNGTCIIITQPSPCQSGSNSTCDQSTHPGNHTCHCPINPPCQPCQPYNGTGSTCEQPQSNQCPPNTNGSCTQSCQPCQSCTPCQQNNGSDPTTGPGSKCEQPASNPCPSGPDKANGNCDQPTHCQPCQPCQSYNGSNPINEPGFRCDPDSHPCRSGSDKSNGNCIPEPEHIDDSFDYDTTGQNATDEDVTKKCCEVITPRQCERKDNEWTCFHRKYQRCGDVCTQPKIYLKPKMIRYQPPILIMPPPPRRIFGRRRKFGGGAVDCSGCIHGGYRCSVECYTYPDCSWSDCAYVDQDTYCEEYDHNET